MHTTENVFSVPNITLNQGHVVLAVELVHIAICHKVAVFGGHLGNSHAVYQLFVALTVGLQILDGDEFQVVLLCQLLQLWCSHHGTIVLHDFAAQTTFLQSSQTHQVYGGFGVTIANKYTIRFCFQWEHMTRTAEIVWFSILFYTFHGSEGTFCGRNSSGGVYMVNRNSKGCLVVVGIVAYHLRKSQFLNVINRHGHTN